MHGYCSPLRFKVNLVPQAAVILVSAPKGFLRFLAAVHKNFLKYVICEKTQLIKFGTNPSFFKCHKEVTLIS